MRLTNVRSIGRYTNKETGRAYNIKKGKEKDGSYDWYYYLVSGTRHIISDRNFHIMFTKTEVEKL
jgi:hypothetical protein